MEEVGLPKSFLQEKMIEVWNKVDLIKEDDPEFKLKVEQSQNSEYPIVMMSCTEGYNKELFLSEVSSLTVDIKDKKLVTLEYPSWEHGKRLNWLIRNANLTADQDFQVDDQGERIKIEVLLDDVVHS